MVSVDKSLLDEKNFETQVTRICDEVFSPYTDRKVSYLVNGVEHDAYYETDLVVHVVEATVSTKKSKAAHDLNKLQDRINDLNKHFRGVKPVTGWFITKFDLPAEQRELLRNYPSNIRHQNYREMVARIIDSSKYLSARSHYRFGSAVDLFNESQNFDQEYFVQTSLARIGNGSKKKPIKLEVLKSWLDTRQINHVLLQGDFGSGKSMHMRELFLHMAKRHTSGKSEAFPISLNLRDFANLESPDEALRRHADRIGVRELGESLIRAWRAGYVSLLIDGFDEMVPRLSLRKGERYFDIRRQALLVVRRFISESHDGSIIVLSGRSHFFPTFEEMKACLGVTDNWERLELNDLASDEELKRFLTKYSATFRPPSWMPRRPLLLGYLAVLDAKKSLGEISTLEASEGWRILLDRFCQREIEQLDMLPLIKEDLLDIYGDLATVARKRSDGVGPITTNDLSETFKALFGDEPEGVVLAQLLRLPGLVQAETKRFESVVRTSNADVIEAKNFVSSDFVDVCSAHYLNRLSEDYADHRLNAFVGLKNSLSTPGIETLRDIASDAEKSSGLIQFINSKSQDNHAQVDLLQGMIYFGVPYRGSHLVIANCNIRSLNLEKIRADYSRINFTNCYFESMLLDYIEDDKFLPRFTDCACERALCVGSQALSLTALQGCDFETVLNREQDLTDQAMTLQSIEERIVYDLFRKIYDQTGPGRVEKALLSGNPPHLHGTVKLVLGNLEKAGFAVKASGVSNDTIWKGVPARASEVRAFLDQPTPKFAKKLCEGLK